MNKKIKSILIIIFLSISLLGVYLSILPKSDEKYYKICKESYGNDAESSLKYLVKKLDGKGAYGDEELSVRSRVIIKLLIDVCKEELGSDVEESKKYLERILTDVSVDDTHKSYMLNKIVENL